MEFQKIRVYRCKSRLLPGHNYESLTKTGRFIFNKLAHKTKRRPYIRSAYFKGEKIFLEYFWPHLKQKHYQEQLRRLKFLECAIEVMKNSRLKPMIGFSTPKEKLYRFFGQTGTQWFAVQIKEDLKRKQKFFMSVFPYEK